MKDVLIVNSETEDLLDNFKIENDEELVIQKQSKKLTPKQKRLINRKNDLKKYCNKQGGFVHMFYVNKKLLFCCNIYYLIVVVSPIHPPIVIRSPAL